MNKYPRKILDCDDAICRFTGVRQSKGWKIGGEDVFYTFCDSKDAYQSNLMLASATLHEYPGQIREAYGVKLPNMNPESVFGFPIPIYPRGKSDEKPVERELPEVESSGNEHDGMEVE